MSAMAERTLEAWGRIDILIASAGSVGTLAGERGMPFALVQLPTADWDEVIDTNLKGVFLSNRAVLPAMLAQGRGEIVNVSSARGARMGLPYSGAYSASKHGLAALTRSLAAEVGSKGVRVQSIMPDVTDTPMMRVPGAVAQEGLLEPKDVAEAILELVTAPDGSMLVDPILAPFAVPTDSVREKERSRSAGDCGGGPLAGKAVIVTGGGSGIGQATCKKLHRLGASVAVVDIKASSAVSTVEFLAAAAGQRQLALAADVRLEADAERICQETMNRFGRIDVLIHSAAILRGKNSGPKILAEVTTEEMNDVIDTNLKGAIHCNRAVLPFMLRQRSGQIINIASTSGLRGRPMDSVYCASKFGVVGLTESLAEEVRHAGIKVQVVCPDAVATPLWDQNGPVRAPANSLSAERVADLIAYMVALPATAMLERVVITPCALGGARKAPEPLITRPRGLGSQ
jgi:3-oxoacyl-[acyl-carrier protein] reductase